MTFKEAVAKAKLLAEILVGTEEGAAVLALVAEVERLRADLAHYPPLRDYRVESGDLCHVHRTYSPDEAVKRALREAVADALANEPDANPASGLCQTTKVCTEGKRPVLFNTGILLCRLKLWRGRPEGWTREDGGPS